MKVYGYFDIGKYTNKTPIYVRNSAVGVNTHI